jgi:hypothetical protein
MAADKFAVCTRFSTPQTFPPAAVSIAPAQERIGLSGMPPSQAVVSRTLGRKSAAGQPAGIYAGATLKGRAKLIESRTVSRS